jgi:hypothetical protein
MAVGVPGPASGQPVRLLRALQGGGRDRPPLRTQSPSSGCILRARGAHGREGPGARLPRYRRQAPRDGYLHTSRQQVEAAGGEVHIS